MIEERQTATFFDIEKDDRAAGEAFVLRSDCGVARVDSPFLGGVGCLLEFKTISAAIQRYETETLRTKQLVLAEPGIAFFSGRWAEPVACEGKGLAQNGEGGITGIDVAVETQVSVGNFI